MDSSFCFSPASGQAIPGKEKKSAMFDKTKKKLAETMGRSVKQAAEPIKAGVKQAANTKVDLYSRILRLGVLILLFIDGTKWVSDASRSEVSPNQIVINNYLTKKDGDG